MNVFGNTLTYCHKEGVVSNGVHQKVKIGPARQGWKEKRYGIKKKLNAHENECEDRAQARSQASIDREKNQAIDNVLAPAETRTRAVEQEDERPSDGEVRNDAEDVQDFLESEESGELSELRKAVTMECKKTELDVPCWSDQGELTI